MVFIPACLAVVIVQVVDIPVDHPSCSSQHAVLQYRLVNYEKKDGSTGKRVRYLHALTFASLHMQYMHVFVHCCAPKLHFPIHMHVHIMM